MKYVYLALNWMFGVLFVVGGFAAFLTSPLAGLSLFLISLLLLPPVREFAFSKTNISIPTKVRGVGIFVFIMAAGIFSGQSQEKIAQEAAAQEAQERTARAAAQRQQNIDYFNQNAERIVADVRAAISSRDWQGAIAASAKYLPAKNPELTELHEKAKAELAAMQRREKTDEILIELKTIPASEYAKNRDLYGQLVQLNPDVPAYTEKLNFYSGKLKAQEDERQSRLVKFGQPPTPSAWDGTYFPVKQYLKKVANDPDSIEIDECTKVYHTDAGWLVGCNYRGRNGFGGMVRQANWFTIVHGTVIAMHEPSAYSPK